MNKALIRFCAGGLACTLFSCVYPPRLPGMGLADVEGHTAACHTKTGTELHFFNGVTLPCADFDVEIARIVEVVERRMGRYAADALTWRLPHLEVGVTNIIPFGSGRAAGYTVCDSGRVVLEHRAAWRHTSLEHELIHVLQDCTPTWPPPGNIEAPVELVMHGHANWCAAGAWATVDELRGKQGFNGEWGRYCVRQMKVLPRPSSSDVSAPREEH